MKLFVLLVIFSQVLFSINALTIRWHQTITILDTDISYNTSVILDALPPNFPGNLTITVETPYPVQICFLPTPSNNFAGCDSTNSFNLAPQSNQVDLASNWLQYETNQINLREDFFGENFDLQFEKYLMAAPKVNRTTFKVYGLFRANTDYFVIAQWSASHNDSISVTVESTTTCSDSQIALPNGTCEEYISGSQQNKFNPQLLPQNNSQWWSFTIDDSPKEGHYYSSFILQAESIASGTFDAGDQDNYYIDFYLKKDSPPLTTDYDLHAKLPRSGQLVVGGDIRKDTIYYFLTQNWNNQSVTLTVATSLTQCPFGTFGNNCSTNATRITTNSSITNKVTGTGGMMYFIINTTQLIFGVGIEKLDSSAPAIYADMDTAPDSTFYMLHSESNNDSDSVRLFWLPNLNNVTMNWVIAVNTTSEQEFYYWANTNCAFNCVPQNTKNYKSVGTCDYATGKCTCPSGYQYLWCDKKGFPGWAIALIVIAVILIIICFIGLPLVWYLRKRRAKYEQV